MIDYISTKCKLQSFESGTNRMQIPAQILVGQNIDDPDGLSIFQEVEHIEKCLEFQFFVWVGEKRVA